MIDNTAALIVFLFPLAYSPGPGNMFFAANGARFGFRATLAANAGYHVATLIAALAIGLGFLAALDRYPGLYLVLKTAGAVYVLWIAWKLFRSGAVDRGQDAVPASFLDGVVLLVLNPKAYVIMGLMFTQFLTGTPATVDAGTSGGQSGQVIFISTIFTLNNLLAFLIWTLAGDALSRCFRTPEMARKLNMFFGLMLAGVALWMLGT